MASTPAPPARPTILDHRIGCQLFGAQSSLGHVAVTTTATSPALARIDVRGDVRDVPLPTSPVSGGIEGGMVVFRSAGAGREYTWLFKLSAPPLFENGSVVVSARQGMGPIRNVATGLCSVTSSKAAYQ